MAAQAAGGQLDNNFGAAGTGAPVARLVNVYTLYDAWSATIGITTARNNGASVINMSFSSRVPSIFDWGVGPSRIYTENLEGPVLLAAAGNSGENVDDMECFLGSCWESHLLWPCESERVICVGGLAHNSLGRDGGSNYGRITERDNTVDIFAPYMGLVAGEAASTNQAVVGSGTSYASPYAAGVVALIRAMLPALSKDEVTRILLESAHVGSSPEVHRVVNALEAVKYTPHIRIQSSVLNNPDAAPLNRNIVLVPAVYLDGRICPPNQCPVSWSPAPPSPTTGSATYRFNSTGPRTITATATLPSGITISHSVTFNVTNQPPVAVIQTAPGTFYRGQSVTFSGYGLDPNEGQGPGDGTLNTGCQWQSSPVSGGSDADSITLTGCNASQVFTIPGNRRVTLRVTDSQGAVSSPVSINISVQEPPAIPGPNATLGISAPNYVDDTYSRMRLITFTMGTPGNGNPPYFFSLRAISYQAGSTTEIYRERMLFESVNPVYPFTWTWMPSASLLLPHNEHDCYVAGQWIRVILTVYDDDGNAGSSANVMFRILCELI